MISLEELKLKRKPFKLSTFLEIYFKSQHHCYVNYMEGTKLLYAWLTNEGSLPLVDDLSEENIIYSPLLVTYEQDKIAELISGETYGPKHNKLSKRVQHYTLRYVICKNQAILSQL